MITPRVGAPGGPSGITLVDAGDGGPIPAKLLAVTVKVYAVPFVKPDTAIGEVVPEPVNPPGNDVTV